MSNALKQITTEAKRIRKAHPKKTWKAAIKEAGKKYRSGSLRKKVGATKLIERGESRKTRPAKTYKVSRTPAGQYKKFSQVAGVQSVAVHKAAVKSHYLVQLSNLLLKKELAKGVRDKRKIAKEVLKVKKALKQFS
jgi:hypothetical protein